MEQCAQWLSDADYILIAAGAGLSAAAGLDYTDTKLFKEMFPAMHRVGFRNMYHFIGYHSKLCPDNETSWSPDLKWGYLAEQVSRARFSWPNHQVYQSILNIVKSVESGRSFVISTNADGMFLQNGFDPDFVYNPQGDYSNLQCLRPCQIDAFWPSKPVIDNILPTIDTQSQRCAMDQVPMCPHCGGAAFFNVRGGPWFLEDVRQQHTKFSTWLQKTRGKKLIILEVGVGFNTPSVLRWPMEQIIENNPNAKLIRINRDHPEVPTDIADRSVSIDTDAAEAVRGITQFLHV
jgi:NAD-dependent SIR2 family protein deacetylase